MADYPTGRRRQIGYLRNGRSWSSSVHHRSRIKSEPFCILCKLWLVCCDWWWFTVMAVSHRLWWLTVIVRSHTALVRSTGSFDQRPGSCQHRMPSNRIPKRIQNRFPLDPLYSINSDIPFKLKNGEWAIFCSVLMPILISSEWCLRVLMLLISAKWWQERAEREVYKIVWVSIVSFAEFHRLNCLTALSEHLFYLSAR